MIDSSWREFIAGGLRGVPGRYRNEAARALALIEPLDLLSDEMHLHHVMSACLRLTTHRLEDGRLRPYRDSDEKHLLIGSGLHPLCGHPFNWFAHASARAARLGSVFGVLDALQSLLARLPDCAFLHAARGRCFRSVWRFADAIREFDKALALLPGDPTIHAWRGEARFELTDIAGARADFDACLKARPRDAWALAWRSEASWLLGRRSEALRDLDLAIAERPRSGALLVLRSRRDGFELLDKAAELSPALFWVFAMRGHVRQQSGDLAGADRDFKRVVRLHPNRWAYARLGANRRRMGDERGARNAFERSSFLEEDGKYAGAGFKALVRCAVYSGVGGDCSMGVEDVGDLTRRLARDPEDARTRVVRSFLIAHDLWRTAELGRAAAGRRHPPILTLWASAVMRDRPAEALALLDEAVRRAPGSGWLHSIRGKCLFRLGRDAEALDALERAYRLYPVNEQACTRGLIHLARGRIRPALDSMNPALEVYWNNTEILLARREANFATGLYGSALEDMECAASDDVDLSWSHGDPRMPAQPEMALRQLERMAASSPADARILAWRGRVLYEEGRLLDARGDLDRAIVLDGGCALARTWRAEMALARGDARGARSDLDAALDSNPLHARAYGARAALRARGGRFQDALEDLDAFLQLIHTDRGAHSLRGRLLRLSGAAAAAAADLDSYLFLHPQEQWARYERARARAALGDFDGALEDLAGVSLSCPAFSFGGRPGRPWIEADWKAELFAQAAGRGAWAGVVRYYLGDPAGAEKCVEPLFRAARGRDLAWAHALRGGARLRLGRAADAIEDLDEAVRLQPKTGWFRLVRAELGLMTGRRAQALTDIRICEASGRWRTHARCLRAKALFLHGKRESALACLDAELQDLPGPHWVFAYLYRARLKRLSGRPADALHDLRLELKAARPDSGWVHYERALASAALGRAGVLVELAAALREEVGSYGGFGLPLLPLAPWEPATDAEALLGAGRRKWGLVWRGAFRVLHGFKVSGERDLERASKLDSRLERSKEWGAWELRRGGGASCPPLPSRPASWSAVQREIAGGSADAAAFARRGRLWAGAERWTEARDDFDRAVRGGWDNAQLRLGRAEAEAKLGAWDGALEDAETAIHQAPGLPAARFWRAQALRELGRDEEALAEIEAYLKFRPRDPSALICRGVLLTRVGRWDEALACFRSTAGKVPSLGRALAVLS